MKPDIRLVVCALRVLVIVFALVCLPHGLQAEEVAAAPQPTIEERLADIEAYMNNAARPEKASGAESLVAGPGPGANAWQMVSTALVLFMTLPGLALFYGGLVRRKNVLSVLAQCLGIACMVTPL